MTGLADRARQVGAYLQRSPGSRSIGYLGMAAATLELVWRVRKPRGSYAVVDLHLPAMPIVVALTYIYARLRPEDHARWNRVPLDQGMIQALQGIGLGTGAFLTWMGVAAARRWISAPAWGWDETSMGTVSQSVALLGVGHLAVAWNEEMVFRGYGFETVREALGQRAAVAVMVPFFAVYHLDYRQWLGLTVSGIPLMLLRLQSDALWLPVGYHWAWNVLQTAVFGPPEAEPSIWPLQLHGPERWVGHPGYPEPGLLSMLIQLAVALLVWLWMRRTRSGRGREPVA